MVKQLGSLIVSLAFSSILVASPWIDSSNIYLRADIQQLSNHQLISVPVNHWPLNWSDLAPDLNKIDMTTLPDDVVMSYRRVMYYYKQAKQSSQPSTIRLSVANQPAKYQYFGSKQREKFELATSKSFTSGNFAVGINALQTHNASDGKNFRLDNSYIAYKYKNWNMVAGTVPMWWGPGWDSALTMSNNARPIPGVSINRQNALPFSYDWLKFIGPWTFTTFFGQLESDRAIPNTNLWSSRFSFRPFPELEVAFTRSSMWGGKGQAGGLSAFFDNLIPNETKNDYVSRGKNVNDLAAFDFRWHGDVFSQPIGVNFQMGFEDYASIIPSKRSYLLGIDTNLYHNKDLYTLFAEASATYLSTCKCIYGHSVYQSGYTYNGRIIGSTFGKNSQTVTFGVLAQTHSDTYWQSRLSYIEEDIDRKYASFIDNATNNYEEIYQWYSSYRFIFAQSQWELGFTLRNVANVIERKNKTELSLSWEYKL